MPADVAGLRPILTFNLHGRLQRLSLANALTVGRSASCDLVLDHGFVSARHCTFTREPDGVSVVDHGSSNGTRVNGGRIDGKVVLASGDVIEVGPYVLTFGFTSDKPSLPPPGPPRERPLISLGAQMSTMTERPNTAPRVVVEVVDGPRPRGAVARTAFRDAVKAAGGVTVLVAGDLDPCDDAGEVLGAVRQMLRDRIGAQADLVAIASGLSALLEGRRRRARVVLARIDPATSKLGMLIAHDAEPHLVRGERELVRLQGERAPMFGTAHIDPGVAPVHERELGPSDVVVLGSASIVGLVRAMWRSEPPFVGKERRAGSVAMWLVNQAAKNGEPGCAVCAEIVKGPR